MYFWPRVVSVSYLDSNTLLLHVCVCVCVCVEGGRGHFIIVASSPCNYEMFKKGKTCIHCLLPFSVAMETNLENR